MAFQETIETRAIAWSKPRVVEYGLFRPLPIHDVDRTKSEDAGRPLCVGTLEDCVAEATKRRNKGEWLLVMWRDCEQWQQLGPEQARELAALAEKGDRVFQPAAALPPRLQPLPFTRFSGPVRPPAWAGR